MDFERIKIRLETIWIRTRAWLKVVIQLGAIALFLLGVLAVYRAHTLGRILKPTILGYEVPALFGFTGYETLLYGGIFVMMLGLGLAYRWTISDSKKRAPY